MSAELPVQPPGLTLTFLRPEEARDLLLRRRVRCVLRADDGLWAPKGRAALVDGYARRAKAAGATLITNVKGLE